ncbi:MAG: ParB N-terminal domain-containing protein [Actinomycetota bacterium]|jgi:ParB family chromosome partitioning protein|nr:ParB N-terminal domain-containing protein [Actinomycetota bacterium]
MTDKLTTEETGTDTQVVGGTLEHLDPHTLVLDTNVRADVDLDAAFVASIKEHGVLMPIAARKASDGRILVRAGQRRTLAAREAGLHSVPVYVQPLTDGDDTANLVNRVAEQIVENDQRRELTEGERARGIQQLLDAGISVTKVARKLSVKADTVKAAEAVGKSETATSALDTGQLSLAEAAALTEFDAFPGALDRLTAAAGTRRFEHVVAQLREEQASWQAQQKVESQWREKGFTVLDELPGATDTSCVELRWLLTAAGDEATENTVTDPAQWAVAIEEDNAVLDVETGEIVDESTVDWNTENDDEAVPAEGLRHANTVKDGTVYLPTFYCLDYQAAGLTLDSWYARRAGVITGTDAPAGDTDEDAAAARAQAEAEQAEAQRRERRKVIALNRLGDAATVVRREFLVKLLTRKTPPKGAGIFTANCLVRDPSLISDYQGPTVSAELLGVDASTGLRKQVTDLPPTGDARAQVLTLAVVLGALEARTPKDAWRGGGGGYLVRSRDYLAFLVEQGYELADVERIITGERSADEVYDETLADGQESDGQADEPDSDG